MILDFIHLYSLQLIYFLILIIMIFIITLIYSNLSNIKCLKDYCILFFNITTFIIINKNKLIFHIKYYIFSNMYIFIK